MKKYCLAIAVGLSVMLCACGNSSISDTTAAEAAASAAETQTAESTTEAEAEAATTEEEAKAETSAAEETAAETETEAQRSEGFSEQDKVLLDNDIATITLSDEVDGSNYVGYSLIIENKSEMNILVGIDNGSVDGLMTYIDLQNANVASGKKSKAEMRFYESNSDVKSLDDLRNIEGAFKISTNTDGGNTYTGNDDRYPFEITGRAGGSSSDTVEAEGQVILDNDLITITLGDTVEESNYVGYSLTLENKSDLYFLVGIDNGSVDGFMTNIDLQGGSVAPGKKSKAEMRFYASNTDVKTLDDLKNVEGSFKISTNDDGSNMYTGNDDRYPFTINGSEPVAAEEQSKESSETAGGEESNASETEAEAETNDNMIVLGEAISTDDWDFTVDNVEFTYELKPRNTSSVYTSYTPEDGKVYIHIDGQYYNKSKKDVCIRDLPIPMADYNDGYTYEGFALADRDDNNFFWASSYVVCEPLSTCHYHGLIECPKVVEEAEEPLYITIKMPNKKIYRYDIR